jgi:UDP-galactopyranose mutase
MKHLSKETGVVKVVGCGLSGITAAVLLKKKGYTPVIFESRNHIGGNCYDSNVCGTLVHNYGPHIFHTDDDEVYNLLSEFTEWIPFKLQPVGNTILGKIPLPYSDITCKQAINQTLTQEDIVNYIFKDYSEKQWGVDFAKIPKSITNRIPKTKDCDNPTWFEGQKYQCIPKEGYTKMFKRMLDGIEVRLNVDDNDWKGYPANLTIYTGKIDSYFDYCYGKLPYRTLEFKHTVTSKKMPYFIQNENNPYVKYTRKYDHSYLTEDHKGLTVITEEYPKICADNDIPYYPMPFGEGIQMYTKYKELANVESNVIFVGRLATYAYLDMWMAVKQVLLKLRNM